MSVITITFYGKPGCVNNTRQQRLLREAGYRLIVRDLLCEEWTPARLQRFFSGMPVADWFNKSAPRVRSGEIRPECLNSEQALALMVEDPLLIRRPLMEAGGRTLVGFEPDRVKAWLGLAMPGVDLETCPRTLGGDGTCAGREEMS